MDAVRFNAMYQLDITRMTEGTRTERLSSNRRSALVQQIRRYTSEATRRQVEHTFIQAVEQQMREGVEGVERRMRIAIMEPLRLEPSYFSEEAQEISARRFAPCPTSFQVVFNGRDIVRVVD
jgi:hypothetical protein